MNRDTQMLQNICQSTQLGQNSIRAVIKEARDHTMQQALASQLREYEAIHHQAQKLLTDRGQSVKKIPNMVLAFSRMGTGMKLARSGCASAIAELMIRDSTRGMVQSIRQNRSGHALDPKVSTLSNRLLQTELANIEQMKPFL